MKTATVRDLRHHFADVAKWIEHGESVTITRNGTAFAFTLALRRGGQAAAKPIYIGLPGSPRGRRWDEGYRWKKPKHFGRGCAIDRMDADAYADSSFLVSLHRADSSHDAALAFMTKAMYSLAFTPLHRIEARNALRNAAASGDMTPAECTLAFRQIEEDLHDGLLIHAPVQWTDVFRYMLMNLQRGNTRRPEGSSTHDGLIACRRSARIESRYLPFIRQKATQAREGRRSEGETSLTFAASNTDGAENPLQPVFRYALPQNTFRPPAILPLTSSLACWRRRKESPLVAKYGFERLTDEPIKGSDWAWLRRHRFVR